MLASAPNFRDIGGWRTEDGRCVRHGLVFRSEALSPDISDVAILDDLHVAVVCDLRSASECAHAPNAHWTSRGTRCVNIDLLDRFPPEAKPWSALRDRPDEDGATDAMLTVYRALPAAAAAPIGELLRMIIDGHLPMLVHCTAGKDRTGFVIAVLLATLGVRREHIMADYLQSNGRIAPAATEATRALALERSGVEVGDAAIAVMMGVTEAYLQASFEVIETQYGGLDTYLADAVGLSRDDRAALQAQLVA